MLTKTVDGKILTLDPQEEANVRAFWDLNTRYPEYVGHCSFDGVNPAYHDMENCKIKHAVYINRCIELALNDVNDSIEKAQEEGTDLQSLYQRRKAIKALSNQDLRKHQNIDELRNSIPNELNPYWEKSTMINI